MVDHRLRLSRLFFSFVHGPNSRPTRSPKPLTFDQTRSAATLVLVPPRVQDGSRSPIPSSPHRDQESHARPVPSGEAEKLATTTLVDSELLALDQDYDVLYGRLPSTDGEGQHNTSMMAQVVPHPTQTIDRKRVKVYELRNNDWFDRGTGLCSSTYITVRAQTGSVASCVRAFLVWPFVPTLRVYYTCES